MLPLEEGHKRESLQHSKGPAREADVHSLLQRDYTWQAFPERPSLLRPVDQITRDTCQSQQTLNGGRAIEETQRRVLARLQVTDSCLMLPNRDWNPVE